MTTYYTYIHTSTININRQSLYKMENLFASAHTLIHSQLMKHIHLPINNGH